MLSEKFSPLNFTKVVTSFFTKKLRCTPSLTATQLMCLMQFQRFRHFSNLCCRVKSFLALTVAQMTQKLFGSQAASQVAKESTSVPARKLLMLETLICIVTSTIGSVQPKTKEIVAFNFNLNYNNNTTTLLLFTHGEN